MEEAICCSEQAAPVLRSSIPARLRKSQECMVALALDSRNRPIGRAYLVAVGTLGSVEVHPRDVFRTVIRRNAASVIIGHNHPSGELTPSPDDARLTERLMRGADLLGIGLLDHIIIGQDGHVSMADRGLLPGGEKL